MLKSYFKIAMRNLWKNKGFTAINIVGLSVGIAACLLILLYIMDELRFDSYNVKESRIYRVDNQMKFGANEFDVAQVGSAMGPVFVQVFPQVEQYVRFRHRGGFLVKKGNENFKEENVIYADSTLFDVFTLPMIAGNPKTALTQPYSLVISESMAKKYFSKTAVLGQSLVINDNTNYQITGVIKDVPANSHFHYDFFIAMAGLDESRNGTWVSQNFNTYFLVKPGVDIQKLEARFNEALEKYAEPEFKGAVNLSIEGLKKTGGYMRCSLTPLNKIHLYSNKPGELDANGNIQYVYIFSAIAVFILLIACVNFMNLSTARSANRAREVGIRKVLGSGRKNLIAQFLAESVFICFLAFIIALCLAWLLVPLFNQLSQKNTGISMLCRPWIVCFLLLLMSLLGLLAGSYPAFFLSAFNPVTVLKGKLAKGFKSSLLRNTLVVFQFSVSVVLIIAAVVVYNQLAYIHSRDIGFNREQLLIIQNTGVLKNQSVAFKNELLQLPGVWDVTVTGFLPITGARSNDVFFNDASLDIRSSLSMQKWGVDENYIPALQIRLAEGRNFSPQFTSDSSGFIINEAAAKLLGKGDPLNKKLYELDDLKTKKIITWHVIGIMKDFNFNSLREQVTPLALSLRTETGSITLRAHTRDMATLLSGIKRKWKAIAPSQPFNYTFLDDEFSHQYSAEERIGKISVSFSVLAILVACLGLFGLVTYAAEQRVKEIGIRKVLGASIPNIISLLSADFIKLVMLAILIASPIAYWAMHQWLEAFAYRVTINWQVFVLAGAAGLFIALVTVGCKAIQSALANPAQSLRSE